MELDINQLRKIADLIFEHIIDDLEVHTVPLEEDYYWNIPSESLYDMQSTPTQPDIGQLHDDLEFLLKTLDDKDQAVALMFTHLSPLLRYVGEKVGQ